MAHRRRIVPDNSVILPAFFQEEFVYKNNRFDLTRRAKPLADAIRSRGVDAFAPDFLMHEFMAQATEKARCRDHSPVLEMDVVGRQLEQFRALPITYAPCNKLAPRAWTLATDLDLSVADAWYLACAIEYDAEFWLSHEHSDGLAERAARAHPGGVHLLVHERFG
ncbi:MAG: type II toxin-antitoxin system VapC family toxin [Planctomycetes bacterium]|nr:type II toxin-antitoxin system VapC family toxin [Planctomycetota bacterium]